jgi:hypothetical protein
VGNSDLKPCTDQKKTKKREGERERWREKRKGKKERRVKKRKKENDYATCLLSRCQVIL